MTRLAVQKNPVPENIGIKPVDTHFFSVRTDEVGVAFSWGKPTLLGPGGHFRFGFFPQHSYVKMVDMREFCKNVRMPVQSRDNFEFDVEADVRIRPKDALYIAQNEDRINGFLERTIQKNLNEISSTIAESEGWGGNVYQHAKSLEEQMAIELGGDGGMYRDTSMRIYCPDQFLAVASTRYGLKHYLEFDMQLKQHFFQWIEKESRLKVEVRERIVNAIGKHPQMLVLGTFSEIFDREWPKDLQDPEYRLVRPYVRGFLQTEVAKRITEGYKKGEVCPAAMQDALDFSWGSFMLNLLPRGRSR